MTDRAGDRAEIADVLATYCHRCDDREFEALVDCFTDDATFVFERWRMVGRDRLRRWFERNQSPGKHITANSVIEVNGDLATATSDYIFVAKGDGHLIVTMAGRYVDELRRVDGKWRIRERVATPM